MPDATTPTKLSIGALLRQYGSDFLAKHDATLTVEQRRAMQDLANCRTETLGGHLWECSQCGRQHRSYHSCRNRHCPACQAGERAAWLEREAKSLLPVEYFHVVFTLPAEVAELAFVNRRLLYGLLFDAAQETLREVAANQKHLGAQLGTLAVLHTWGQNLHHHPHLHCVVTGGGLACDKAGRVQEPAVWVSCRPGFFLPVRVLSRLFRGKYLAGLNQAYEAGQLRLPEALVGANAFAAWINARRRQEWVVYAKPPFGGPEQVLKYLARYTHRVALSNQRLLSVEDGQVTFSWKDYRRENKQRRMTLSVEEFLRRFLQHVLPRGFVKVRHYGLLSNRSREQKLGLCRWLLLLAGLCLRALLRATGTVAQGPRSCPECGAEMRVVQRLLPQGSKRSASVEVDDSS